MLVETQLTNVRSTFSIVILDIQGTIQSKMDLPLEKVSKITCAALFDNKLTNQNNSDLISISSVFRDVSRVRMNYDSDKHAPHERNIYFILVLLCGNTR